MQGDLVVRTVIRGEPITLAQAIEDIDLSKPDLIPNTIQYGEDWEGMVNELLVNLAGPNALTSREVWFHLSGEVSFGTKFIRNRYLTPDTMVMLNGAGLVVKVLHKGKGEEESK